MKKLFLFAGNGMTIDLLARNGFKDKLDVSNLFAYGSHVPWPSSSEPGFLSFKRCPNLWNLGARPFMDKDQAIALIEDIVTCVNVFASVPPAQRAEKGSRTNDIYIAAFKELSIYLKHLFVYYDRVLDIENEAFLGWPWIEFLRRVNESEDFGEIVIVSYNYDVWLEKLLGKANVPFEIHLNDFHPRPKIRIYKPHGSISFAHCRTLDKDAFQISTDRELVDGELKDFYVRYDDLDDNFAVNALIPPAGEAGRFNHSWASQIREAAKSAVANSADGDEVIICGLSYWHVDRAELDELLVSLSPKANIKMVNPAPSRALTAVLASRFDNFISYSTTDLLPEVCK